MSRPAMLACFPPVPDSASSRAGSVADWLRAELFLRTETGPVGWRKILLGLAFVVAGPRSPWPAPAAQER